MAESKKLSAIAANDADPSGGPAPQFEPNPFPHLIVGFVGYLGSGCSDIAEKLQGHLRKRGYDARIISVSRLIEKHLKLTVNRFATETDGEFAFRRTNALQNSGDEIRSRNNPASCVALALKEMLALREANKDTEKFVFLIDSLKHAEEVEVLRRLYKGSFRLVSVFADRKKREFRLIDSPGAKFKGIDRRQVRALLDRDEMDTDTKAGQQVRKAFYLGDYFVNNNMDSISAASIDTGLARFIDLLLGNGLHRPKQDEQGIHSAFAAALRSACLSRQVGAVLVSADGNVLAIGANEVPKFGGGTYDEDSPRPERRCFAWEYTSDGSVFVGCHKDRKNRQIEEQIRKWVAENLLSADHLSKDLKIDSVGKRLLATVGAHLEKSADIAGMPGVSDIIEYSRSIHAEMDALLAAARAGRCPVGATLYCTTYPCHNCARHMVAAGIRRVVYVEPYVKSQAVDLHQDSVTEFADEAIDPETGNPIKMIIEAFTGVGPRMYDHHFIKTKELKAPDGRYVQSSGNFVPITAIAVDSLEESENRFIKHLLPEHVDG